MMMDNDYPKTLGFLHGYIDYNQKAKEFGSPFVEQNLISGSPSFELPPDIDSPIVDRWIKEYNARNPKRYTDTMEDALERARALGRRLRGV